LVKRLQAVGATVTVPARQDTSWLQQDLGHVIYAIGRTADFRGRPHDTVEAHVGLRSQLLRDGRFDSLLDLSSTRVYQGMPQGNEGADLIVNPNSPDDLYNLSKLLGESLCLNDTRQMVRVARLIQCLRPQPAHQLFAQPNRGRPRRLPLNAAGSSANP
jgi:hypothetical protein